MKKKVLLSTVLLSTVLLAGCGGSGTSEAPAPTGGELSGKIAVSGSTSTEKIMIALADEYMALNEGVQITYEGIGSSAGLKNAKEGISDIGTASRGLKSEEKGWGLNENTFAYDGIALIIHPDNPVQDLTIEQAKAIYAGEIKNWKEVGGEDQAIVLVSREDGSGTRGAFEEILGLEAIRSDANIAEGNGNVQTTVAGNPQAIGYVSFAYINDSVKGLTVNGAEPTTENVLNEVYELSRPFIMVSQPSATEVTNDFIEFIGSEEGQDIVEENGGIPTA